MPEVRKKYYPQRFCATGDIAEPRRATTESSATRNRAERRPTFGAIVGVVEPVAVHSFGESGETWVAEIFRRTKYISVTRKRGRFGWIFRNPIAFDASVLRARLAELGNAARWSPHANLRRAPGDGRKH